MTSESQHPGQEPDDAVPSAAPSWPGGHVSWPTDEPPQHRVSGAPDMAWTPPPARVQPAPGANWTVPVNGTIPAPVAPPGGTPPDWAPAPERGDAFPPDWAPGPSGDQPSDRGPAFPPDWAPSPGPGDSAAASGLPPAMADGPGWAGPPNWEAPSATSEPVTPGGGQPAWDVPRTPSGPPINPFAPPGAASETGLPQREPGHFEPDRPEPRWHEAPAAPARPGPGQAEYPSYAQAPTAPEPGWHEPAQRDYSAYQPGPAPGIAAPPAVPLPPQETRVPGASLAAAPPADFDSSPYPPRPGDDPYEAAGVEQAFAGHGGRPVERATVGDEAQQRAWAPEVSVPPASAEAPQAQSTGFGPVGAQSAVPAPRMPSDPPAAGRVSVPQQVVPDLESAGAAAAAAAPAVSASASVPASSRVMPPADYGFQSAGSAAAQPRVYGRPVVPEPAEDAHGRPGQHPNPAMGVFGDPGSSGGAPGAFGDGPPRPAAGSARVAPPAPAAMPTAPAPSDAPSMSGGGFAPYADLIGDERTGAGPGAAVDPMSPPSGVARPVSPATGAARPVGAAPSGVGPWDGPHPAAGPDQMATAVPAHPWAMSDPGRVPTMGQAGRPDGMPLTPATGGPGAFPGPVAWAPPEQRDQPRFDSFSPEAEPKAEPPVPNVRNGRVLAAVLAAAVLLLVVPLGIVWLLTRGGDPAFDPEVGACVKQAGSTGAVTASCGDPGAFTVVSKVDDPTKCADQAQPHIVIPASGGNQRVLCLRPASGG